MQESWAYGRRSPQHNKKFMTPTVTQGHCPTPQNSPTYIAMNAAAATPKPNQTEIWGILPDKRRISMDGLHV